MTKYSFICGKRTDLITEFLLATYTEVNAVQSNLDKVTDCNCRCSMGTFSLPFLLLIEAALYSLPLRLAAFALLYQITEQNTF